MAKAARAGLNKKKVRVIRAFTDDTDVQFEARKKRVYSLSVLTTLGRPTHLSRRSTTGVKVIVFASGVVLLARTFLSGLRIIRRPSRCLPAEILFAKIVVLARATHVPIEIVVRHSVMCHVVCILPQNGY